MLSEKASHFDRSDINSTLEELNSQQHARLSALIENLLAQQQKFISNILSSSCQFEKETTLDAKVDLQELLIGEELTSPIDTITQRMHLTELYLNKIKQQYKIKQQCKNKTLEQ